VGNFSVAKYELVANADAKGGRVFWRENRFVTNQKDKTNYEEYCASRSSASIASAPSSRTARKHPLAVKTGRSASQA